MDSNQYEQEIDKTYRYSVNRRRHESCIVLNQRRSRQGAFIQVAEVEARLKTQHLLR